MSSTVSTGPSLNKKLLVSAVSALFFVAVSLPQVYTQTSRITTTFADSCPTPEGKFIHAAVFFALNYFAMKVGASQKVLGLERKSDGLLAKYAFMGTLLFIALSSTDAYRLTGRAINGLANEYGCPEVKGIIVHGLVFMVVLVLIMLFPKDQ